MIRIRFMASVMSFENVDDGRTDDNGQTDACLLGAGAGSWFISKTGT